MESKDFYEDFVGSFTVSKVTSKLTDWESGGSMRFSGLSGSGPHNPPGATFEARGDGVKS